MYVQTTATKKIFALTGKIRALQGGTSSSKTISTLLYLIDKAQSDKKPTLTSVVAESVPHLKRGAMRDFERILKAHGYWRDKLWNKTDKVYTFETGSQIEFFSSDNGDKLRGGRRDRCFMNEANNQTLDAFDQLEVRTKEFVILDWNPSNEFWFYTDVKGTRDDVDHIILTYKDNEALPDEIVTSIEARKKNKSWWKVYGLGQLGEIEGRIYTGWEIIDEIPPEARLERRGMDFGYTNDPTTIVAVYYCDGAFILDEELYRKGLSNKNIADFVLGLSHKPHCLIKADSAEPKSIAELKTYGVNVQPAQKGPGSINQGISYIQDQKIFITKRSANLINEYRNYMWDTDSSGRSINKPVKTMDHALDAVRYALTQKRVKEVTKDQISRLYDKRRRLQRNTAR